MTVKFSADNALLVHRARSSSTPKQYYRQYAGSMSPT
ncbi:unnamed protein product [Mycetohabitans rhizoxinica HKI 454]|uniref:Uncharacterized protein n=1 Tax=Mycetohabitans rhizoxinica (strain DSM 19002 / CIP 109453 / HKI 454) TaxID=882378 RepID=E5AL80_MYCRK|nr:unnamed protein product [Mycetohabitans rhizoxinica HKI 454]